MHLSAMACMSDCIERHLSKDRHYDLLDFGSFINSGQDRSLRDLLVGYDVSYTGVDIQAGRNVDILMTQPYRIPVPSASQDVVISGQVFEHIPFPFASMLEIARVLRTGGLFFMTVPSRGHRHSTYDLWRFYPDSMRAFAQHAELELLWVDTDWPPPVAESRRLDYAAIKADFHYWGDTTAVFRKPSWQPSPWRTLHRKVALRHANRLGPLPAPLEPRDQPSRRERRAGQRELARVLERLDRRRARQAARRETRRAARREARRAASGQP